MKLTKRKDGRWQYNFSPEKGKKPKPFYSRQSDERKAEKEIINKIAEYEKSNHKSKHNFKVLAEKMIAMKENEVGFKTWEGYSIALKHLESFHDMDIEDISASMLNSLLQKMSNRNYSYSSISKTKITFGLTLNYAIVYEDLKLINFTKEVKIPKNAHKGVIKSPDDYIIDCIVKNAEKVEFGMWAMIELCAGLRRGEIAALQIKKINFKNNEIDIKDAAEFIGNTPHVKPKPKTDASIGKVPIISILREPLKRFCENRNSEEYLFGGEKPLTVTQINKRWKKYYKSIGTTKFNQHQLRHAYAKLLYLAGIDPKTMQALLRHADFSTTMNIYTEFVEEMNKKSVTKLNKYIDSRYSVVNVLSN